MEYDAPAVTTSIRIMKLLSRYRHKSCSLKEISDLTQVNKTSCLRILRTLEREDFVKYDSKRKEYSLGPYLIALGSRALELNPMVAAAAAELAAVAAEVGLTTVLIRRISQDRAIYLASEHPPGNHPKISISIGQHVPLTGVSFGWCFLAYDSEADWQHFTDAGLVPYTPDSIVDPSTFAATLRAVRQAGYTVSHGSLTSGLSAVAAPIFNRSGQVELVVACLAMTSELDSAYESRVIKTLTASTERLSALHGFSIDPTGDQSRDFEDYGR